MKTLEDVAQDFAKLFDELKIPYAMMGGLAVRIHAIPRPTYDVDFTISLPRERLPELYPVAESKGYTLPEAQETGWIVTVKGLSVIKFQWYILDRTIDVDVFLAESHFQQQVLQRRQSHVTERGQAWFVSPEDLVLLKLLAYRPKDQVDVLDILFVQGQLDVAYMRTWANRLKVGDRLEAVLSQ